MRLRIRSSYGSFSRPSLHHETISAYPCSRALASLRAFYSKSTAQVNHLYRRRRRSRIPSRIIVCVDCAILLLDMRLACTTEKSSLTGFAVGDHS